MLMGRFGAANGGRDGEPDRAAEDRAQSGEDDITVVVLGDPLDVVIGHLEQGGVVEDSHQSSHLQQGPGPVGQTLLVKGRQRGAPDLWPVADGGIAHLPVTALSARLSTGTSTACV